MEKSLQKDSLPGADAMDKLLQKAWWMLALRGAAGVLFGVLAILWPGITLLVLVALFAAYAFVTAIVSVSAGIQNRKTDKGWWLLLVLGIVAFAAGVVSVMYPDVTALFLVVLMGANALFTGALDIAIAVRLRKTIKGEWLLVLAGILSIVFGTLVLIFPGAGALALVWMVSFYSTFTGVLLLALAFRMRSSAKPTQGPGDRLVGAS
jgi:uncharacterized membrane protein HdeD (DUF308 family)